MEFDIFGSCLSRDGFEYDSNKHKVNHYFARSSLVSSLKKPLKNTDIDLNLESNFLKRTVKDDLTKRFKKYVSKPKSKVIIVDLIQERYPLIQREGSLFTYSADYRRANLPKGKMIKGINQLKLFEKYIENISELFKQYDYVILHEVNLATEYYDKDGEVKLFELYEKDEFFIEYGQTYYDLLKSNINNCYTLKIEGFKGTELHKWGAAPSHYVDEYYEKYNEGIDFIINNQKDYYYNNN